MPSKHSRALSLGPAGQEHQLYLWPPGDAHGGGGVCFLATQGQVSMGPWGWASPSDRSIYSPQQSPHARADSNKA